MKIALEFAGYVATAAARLLSDLQIEDAARVAWDDCGCGTPEFERWGRATEARCESASALRAALYEFERRCGDGCWIAIAAQAPPDDVPVLLFSSHVHETNPARIEVREYRNTRGGSQHAWATHWMPLPDMPTETPRWTDKDKAMLALNAIVAMQGGENGPSLQLREFIALQGGEK